jgi:hypothetical protein
VLGIIAELHDVPMAIVGLQQVSLGSASHFSHVADSSEGHRKENAVI